MQVTIDINSDKKLRKEVLNMVEGQLSKLGRDHVEQAVLGAATKKIDNMSTMDLKTIVSSKLDAATVRELATEALSAWTQDRVDAKVNEKINGRVDLYMHIEGKIVLEELLKKKLAGFNLNISLENT
jgi:hypothetical protein